MINRKASSVNSNKQYSIFPKVVNDATTEPMFLGNNINVQRYDKQKYEFFDKMYEKQISFFWRPDEIDLSPDRIDFGKLSDAEKHIFTSNLKYQTLLDSIQGRSPSVAFLPLTSLPEIEEFINAWQFFEVIHSRSYTHIIRNVYPNPSIVLDDIMVNEAIMRRAKVIGDYYDDLIQYSMRMHMGMDYNRKELKRRLLLCMVCVNVLEAIRFYVSFACSFAFAERELMEGNAKIIKLIARDEACHLTVTQTILNYWRTGKDDPEMAELWVENRAEIMKIFETAASQEKEWADYLFKDGSMLGLNKEILNNYVEFITNQRIRAIGLDMLFPNSTQNPISWINAWLSSDNVQVAPQEVEISSYLIGQIDAEVSADDLSDMTL
nr:MAG TPA: ribonucleotide-diphosphate reductase subunit beta [Caudoviricetes sp.]